MYAIRSLISRLTAPIRFLGRWTVGLSGAPRRLLGLSLPARVASLLAIFLVLLAIAAYVGFFLSNDRTHWYEWTRFRRMGVIALLLAATPFAVYKTLSLWLEGEVSRFPEIDRAWQEGLDALKANGVDLCETPIFLVLGTPDEQLADSIMNATAFKFIFEGVPAGRGPLRWYVDDQAVYLFVSQLGCLSRLNYLATTSAPVGAGGEIGERWSLKATPPFAGPPLPRDRQSVTPDHPSARMRFVGRRLLPRPMKLRIRSAQARSVQQWSRARPHRGRHRMRRRSPVAEAVR